MSASGRPVRMCESRLTRFLEALLSGSMVLILASVITGKDILAVFALLIALGLRSARRVTQVSQGAVRS